MLDAAWTLDVENLTKGWTLSTWAGKSDTELTPADPLLIQAPFKGSWAWGDYPINWQPRVAQLELRALSAAALEDGAPVDPGDMVDVHLYREANLGHGVRKLTWHRVCGFLDEPEASQDDRGLVVKLAAVDTLAQLAEIPVDDAVQWPQESLGARVSRIAQLAGINIVTNAAWMTGTTLGAVTVNNKGALQLLQECLAGVMVGDAYLVLRGTIGTREWVSLFDPVAGQYDTVYNGSDGPAYTVDAAGITYTGTDQPLYVIDRVGRLSNMSAPYVLTDAHDLGAPGAPVGVGLRVATRTPLPDLTDVTGGAALDADDVLRDGTSWIKSRATSINQVKLVGINALAEEQSVTAAYTDLVKRDGPSTRTVTTQRLIGVGAATFAAQLLPDRQTATPTWTAEQFVLTTKALSWAELNHAALNLYPNEPVGATLVPWMQTPVAIVDVDPTAALTGGDLSGVLQGATVQIGRGGVLQLVGELRMEQLKPDGTRSTLVTWDQLKTEPVDNEPAVQWSTFTWRSDDAVPYTGSDRTFDADQAHPSFEHEQLTWLDLRLMRVES